MSLGNREGGADDDAEPEDLPNLVRRSAAPRGGAPPPLHPAMDRTAGFFRVRKPRQPLTGLLHGRAPDAVRNVYLACTGEFSRVYQGGTWK